MTDQSATEEILFRGQDGSEAEGFIAAVRKAAFAAGKNPQEDDEWIAHFASTCFTAMALRWFESLDDDVQSSWKLLRKALLVKYPASVEPTYIPTPAAAPPPLSPRSDQSQASSQQDAKSLRSSSLSNANTHQVESIVTKVLVNLKQLLSSLASWSQGNITEQAVSDVYVQLGDNINACIVEFSKHGIDASNLGAMTTGLRPVLESALAEQPSPEYLEPFLPSVREIITRGLQELRQLQGRYRTAVEQSR